MYNVMHLPGVIEIGVTGENQFRRLEFDMRPWLEVLPGGVGSIVHIRPGETGDDAYVAATTMEDGILTWELTAGDVGEVEGYGQMEVWLEDPNTARGKSAKCQTYVRSSLAITHEIPEAQEAWLEQMTGLKTETVIAAQSAEDAKEAAESAQTAAEAARDAAQAAAGDFQGLSATASGLAAGTSPTVNVTHDEGGLFNLAFGIPKGDKGDQGDPPTDSQVQTAANNYLSRVITNPDSPPLDRALSSNTAAAPADMVGDLKSAITRNNGAIYADGNEISSSTGYVAKITDGHCELIQNPSGYWKYLIAPIDCLYIDGVAKLKTGGLAGNESQGTPAMAFLDKNYDVVGTPVYSAITAQHTFNRSDVPSGAMYVVCDYSSPFTFAYQSVTQQTATNKADIAALNDQFEQAGKYEVELNFARTTGYYNKDKGFITYDGVTVAEVSASAGDVFFLTSRNYYDMARAVYLNSSNAVIDVLFTGNNASDNSNTRFVAPANTAKILIQTVYAYACTLWKASIADRIGNLNTQVSAIGNATTEPSATDVPLTFESATGYRDKNGGMSTYSGVTIARVAVTAGQKYEVTSRNYYNAAYAFFEDSNNTFLQSLWVANNTQEIKVIVSIPPGVAYLVIQRVYAFYPTTVGLVTGIERVPTKSILAGKKLTLIGDSITEKNFRAKVNWALNLHVWCGAVIQNLGVGGTGFKAGVAQSKNYIARLSQIQASPDVIGVALSWNDMGDSSFPIGTATDTGTESLAGYANDFLDALITAYPTTPIISYSQGPWWSYHPGVERSDEWISVYKQICALKGIPFYSELYDGCTLKPWLLASRQQYYTSDDPDAGNTGVVDDVHPNSEGHKVIARILYPKFAQNLVTSGIDYM